MNQLMETMFDLFGCEQPTDAERRAVRESSDVIQAVKERLTNEEFDKFWNAVMKIGDGSDQDSFTLGFQPQLPRSALYSILTGAAFLAVRLFFQDSQPL